MASRPTRPPISTRRRSPPTGASERGRDGGENEHRFQSFAEHDHARVGNDSGAADGGVAERSGDSLRVFLGAVAGTHDVRRSPGGLNDGPQVGTRLAGQRPVGGLQAAGGTKLDQRVRAGGCGSRWIGSAALGRAGGLAQKGVDRPIGLGRMWRSQAGTLQHPSDGGGQPADRLRYRPGLQSYTRRVQGALQPSGRDPCLVRRSRGRQLGDLYAQRRGQRTDALSLAGVVAGVSAGKQIRNERGGGQRALR